ncbi:sensor domain-containing diguanylate cyclase [Thiocystis violacea]|uniref:sensor domain-containing diguanylate cyclase n=1 Tax=Thiocystis violacea TaxID=13725 RepID=UPI0019064F0D|nr:sensor domain-containing diguanylate cyclase [Thiocystis violacea]MBK1716817.1 hypothetical protein [Thiocystis violacea]
MPRTAGTHLSREAGLTIFLGTLLVTITLGTLLHLTQTYHAGLEIQRAFAAIHARTAEDFLTQNLGVIDLTLRALIENEVLEKPDELVRAVRHAPYLRSLSLADADGRLIASSNPANLGARIEIEDVLPPLAASGDALRFGRPREGRDIRDSRPIAANGTDPAARTFLPAIMAIGDGPRRQWLVAAINVDYFVNQYMRNLEDLHGIVEVFRYDATLVLTTDPGRPPGLVEPGAIAFQSGIPPRVEIGAFTQASLAGRPTLGAYRASRRFPFMVTTHIPYEHVLAEWRRARDPVLRLVLSVLTVVMLLSVAVLYQLRRITADHRRAEQAARDYQQLREHMRQKEAEQARLEQLAMLDPLTGLHNRRYLDDAGARVFLRVQQNGLALTVAALDIDHFKIVNDTYGHPGGDRILVALAELLRAQTRSVDIVCRIGGEEFLLLLAELPLPAAIERAEQLRRAFAGLVVPFGEFSLRATLSLGLASYPEHGDTLESLIQHADQALYAAKHRGRNRVEIAGGFGETPSQRVDALHGPDPPMDRRPVA